MRLTLFILSSFICLSAQAAGVCQINDFLKSTDGQEKLADLVERSKSLILSKLEELAIEEKQVQIKAIYPKSAENFKSSLSISINSKNIKAEGSTFKLLKVIRDEDCGLEITISGGHVFNKESGKDFGSLGRVKEFVRIK